MTMYRMELTESESRVPDWIIELEIGNGFGRNHALITDLRGSRATSIAEGGFEVTGGRSMMLELDEIPAAETAAQTADEIAMTLLEVPGTAKPSDLVLYIFHVGLSAATAQRRPAHQYYFRYAAIETKETSVRGGRPSASAISTNLKIRGRGNRHRVSFGHRNVGAGNFEPVVPTQRRTRQLYQ